MTKARKLGKPAVRYNVPMRYARRDLALAYLAGRRSGLADVAARVIMDHALAALVREAENHMPPVAVPGILSALRATPDFSRCLAAMAEDPDAEWLKGTGKTSMPGVCRICGCTRDKPCAGGCWWVDDAETLCSACVGKEGDAP